MMIVVGDKVVLGIFIRFTQVGFERYKFADVMTCEGLKNIRMFAVNKVENERQEGNTH